MVVRVSMSARPSILHSRRVASMFDGILIMTKHCLRTPNALFVQTDIALSIYKYQALFLVNIDSRHTTYHVDNPDKTFPLITHLDNIKIIVIDTDFVFLELDVMCMFEENLVCLTRRHLICP